MQWKFKFMRFSIWIVIALCPSAASSAVDTTYMYTWEPVQHDMRLKEGDYQASISDEERCKTRCIETSSCIGVDWYTGHSSCFLLYDANATPYHGNGYRHWRITQTRSTLVDNEATPTISTPLTSDASIVSRGAKVHPTTQKSPVQNRNTDEHYTWNPVQLDTRVKIGEFRPNLRNETACKAECILTASCVGVYWYVSANSCNFHTDCSTTLEKESGWHYWSIQKYIQAPATCPGRFEKSAEQSRNCELQYSTTVVNTLGALLSVLTVAIIALLFNTYRLSRQIPKLHPVHQPTVQFVQQVQEEGYDNAIEYTDQSAVYLEIIGNQIPMQSDNENVYDDLEEVRRR